MRRVDGWISEEGAPSKQQGPSGGLVNIVSKAAQTFDMKYPSSVLQPKAKLESDVRNERCCEAAKVRSRCACFFYVGRVEVEALCA